jgi:two-component system, LytTR family, response regulator
MKTAIIIDDEPLSIEALKLKIAKANADIEVIESFFSAKEAVNKIEDLDPDLVFLDIEMPELNGFGFLEKIENRRFEVIITTAHDAYAIKAVRFSAIDFLLKPVDTDELKEAIQRFMEKMTAKQIKDKLPSTKLNAKFDKIPIPTLRGLQFVHIAEILYLASEGNYTQIYLENKDNIVSSKSLGDYEILLESLHFFRIHHSTIINLSQIREYLKGEGGSVILRNGAELDVAKRKKKEFLELIGFG